MSNQAERILEQMKRLAKRWREIADDCERSRAILWSPIGSADRALAEGEAHGLRGCAADLESLAAGWRKRPEE